MSPSIYLLTITVGFVAGFFNALAGGGSTITLPLLIFLGLPGEIANGTNRVAVFVQNCVSAAGFKKLGVSRFRLSLALSLLAVIGAWVGVQFSLKLDDTLFKKILAVTMILVTLLTFVRPKKKGKDRTGDQVLTRKEFLILLLVFLLIGLYIGFIQVGAGLMTILVLSYFSNLNLITINAIKVVTNGLTVLVSMIVFWNHGMINWQAAMPLTIGMAAGGWVGSHVAVKKGERAIKLAMAIASLGMAVKLVFF